MAGQRCVGCPSQSYVGDLIQTTLEHDPPICRRTPKRAPTPPIPTPAQERSVAPLPHAPMPTIDFYFIAATHRVGYQAHRRKTCHGGGIPPKAGLIRAALRRPSWIRHADAVPVDNLGNAVGVELEQRANVGQTALAVSTPPSKEIPSETWTNATIANGAPPLSPIGSSRDAPPPLQPSVETPEPGRQAPRSHC